MPVSVWFGAADKDTLEGLRYYPRNGSMITRYTVPSSTWEDT